MPDPGSTPEDAYLRVELDVTPPPDAECAILNSGERGTVRMQRTISTDESGESQRCRVEAAPSDTPPRLLEGTVTAGCVCPVFRDLDCLATVEAFENDSLSVTVAVADREALSTVVAALRERGATVRLQRIARSNMDTGKRMLELDADSITDKQREAVQVAVRNGYYETPREADLADLADHLGVSRSAISQRLTAVESKLIEELFHAGVEDSGATESAAGD